MLCHLEALFMKLAKQFNSPKISFNKKKIIDLLSPAKKYRLIIWKKKKYQITEHCWTFCICLYFLVNFILSKSRFLAQSINHKKSYFLIKK